MDKIVMIGCGGVGQGLLELFNHEDLYRKCYIEIIEPKDIPEYDFLVDGRDVKHIQTHMTRENCEELLRDCDKKTLIINVSVNVDSIMILRVAKQKGSWYIDTSLEQYDDHMKVPIEKITRYSQFKLNNLYHQQLEAEKTIGKSRKTRIISGGMNPGFISEYAKKALLEYAKLKGKKLENGNYAKLGHELGVKEMLCVEYDSQKYRRHSTPNHMISDWSPYGLLEEASDLVMVSLNNDDLEEYGKNFKLIKPTEGRKDTHVRFIPHRGMDIARDSWTLDREGKPFKYSGMLIPHQEIVSLSDFFQYNGDAPTVYYVYSPSEEAQRSLGFFEKSGYKFPKSEEVIKSKDVISGFDSIGALLTFKNGDKFWGGTVCDLRDVKKFKFHMNPTILQIVAFMNAAIKWILRHKDRGLVTTEDVGHEFIFKEASKYMGGQWFKLIK